MSGIAAAVATLRRASERDRITFARTLRVEPDIWQARVLRSESKRLLLNCSRQAGKSTVVAIATLHTAVFEPESLQLLISPSFRQSGELFGKVRFFLGRIPWGVGVAKETEHELVLDNGARIVSLPGTADTVRGYSAARRVIEDEAAFVPDSVHAAISPMVAVSGGDFWMLSTPNGRRGHFFEAWEHGQDRWTLERVTAWDVPRIPRGFLEAERRSYQLSGRGEQFRQEYECEFINAATGRVYASFDAQRNCIERAPANLDDPRERARWHFLLGIDYGVVDPCAFTVIGWRDHDPTVFVWESYRMPDNDPTSAAEEAKRLEERFKFDVIVGDVGGMGKSFAMEGIRRHQLPVEAAEKHNKPGYIALLNADLARARIKIVAPKCQHLIEEWLTLPWAEAPGWEPGRTHGDRAREAPGYANHAADSCLYVWRRAYAFLEEPAAVPTARGTAEAYAKEAEDIYERRQADLQRERKEWWDS